METTKKKRPPFGIGYLGSVNDKNLEYLTVLAELILFTLIGAVSWYLLIICVAFFYGCAFSSELTFFGKKLVLYFIPKIDSSSNQMKTISNNKKRRLLSYETPDKVSVGWINDIIENVWTLCLKPLVTEETLNSIILNTAAKCKNPKIAAVLRQISVRTFTVGTSPFVISKIVSHAEHKNELKVEVKVVYKGNAEIAVKWRNPEVFAIGENLGLSLHFQVDVGPIHRDLSLVGGASFSFLEIPQLVLDGGGVLYLPVEILKVLYNMLKKPAFEWIALSPRCVSLSLNDGKGHAPHLGKASGVVRILLIEAKDLLEADTSIFGVCGIKKRGTSDPYCILELDRISVRSPTIEKTTNPVWNFYAELPVMEPGPICQEMVIKILDEDVGSKEGEPLGSTSIDLGTLDLHDGAVSEAWLSLNTMGIPSGRVRLKLQWVPCIDVWPTDLNQEAWPNSCSKAILVVHIKSILSNEKLEPMVSVQVGSNSFQTTAKGYICHQFDFEEKLVLLVSNPDSDWVTITLHDMSETYFNAGRFLKKGLSIVNSTYDQILNASSTAHKGKDVADIDAVGSISFPVTKFIKKKNFTRRLKTNKNFEVKVRFSAQVWALNMIPFNANPLFHYENKR